jgi:hypothetical protein
MVTKAEIAAAIKGYDLVHKAAEETAERWLKIFGNSREYITNMEVDCWDVDWEQYDGDEFTGGGSIDISTEANYCSCCSPDYDSHTIPLSYIWDEEWEDREREKIAEAKRLEEERKAAKKAEDAKKREEKRYADFLKMKEEYEGK